MKTSETMNDNYYWLPFYKEVRNKLIRHYNKCCLCSVSEWFEMEWEGAAQWRIKEDAIAFLRETDAKGFCIGNAFLFDYTGGPALPCSHEKKAREIRLKFLNWIIEKLERKESGAA